MASPIKPVVLFGRSVSGSNNTSPSQFANTVRHNKPRLVRTYSDSSHDQASEEPNSSSDVYDSNPRGIETQDREELSPNRASHKHSSSAIFSEELSASIEVEELTGDPRYARPTPTPTRTPVVTPKSPPTPTPVLTPTSTPRPKHAIAVVTPKNSHVTRYTPVQVSEEEYGDEGEDADEDMDENIYENTNMDDDDDDEVPGAIQGPQRNPKDPLASIYGPNYYTQSDHQLVGIGKRPRGKVYGKVKGGGGKAPRGSGGKAPRGVGGKAPRVPGGRGKAPAFSPEERKEQQVRKTKILEGARPNNNDTTLARRKKSNKKITRREIDYVPVGKPQRKSHVDKEIRKYQAQTTFMIPKKRFQNLVREIVQEILMVPDLRWARTSLEALQCAAEDFISEWLDLSNSATIHAKRRTAMIADTRLILLINPILKKLVEQLKKALAEEAEAKQKEKQIVKAKKRVIKGTF